MKNKLFPLLYVAACLFPLSVPVLAHHGLAAYDLTHPLTMTGTVKLFQFFQPHALIIFEVKDEEGHSVEWSVEMASPTHLSLYGWSAKKLKPGDQITVTGAPARNGQKVLTLRKISWTGGEEIPLGPSR
jgi:hypothetical protein